MNTRHFALLAVTLGVLLMNGTAEARSGCCSSHGGVCGCGCCDGTGLSQTCAPYYPQCGEYGGGGVHQDAPSYTSPVITNTKMPSCPADQSFSLDKSECVCPSTKMKNKNGACVCKTGFTQSGTTCTKLPPVTKDLTSKVKACEKGFMKQGTKCIKEAKIVLSSKSSSSKALKKIVTSSSATCVIKGNISSKKEKIYHLPGCTSYSQTIIDTAAGERMFCTEAEAKKSGWRKALNCR